MLGLVKACVVYLVSEHIFCLGSSEGKIQASEQLEQGFPFSPHQHRQRVFPLVRDGQAFGQRRNDPNTDSAQFDDLVDVG
jgi:hypothetical protein